MSMDTFIISPCYLSCSNNQLLASYLISYCSISYHRLKTLSIWQLSKEDGFLILFWKCPKFSELVNFVTILGIGIENLSNGIKNKPMFGPEVLEITTYWLAIYLQVVNLTLSIYMAAVKCRWHSHFVLKMSKNFRFVEFCDQI